MLAVGAQGPAVGTGPREPRTVLVEERRADALLVGGEVREHQQLLTGEGAEQPIDVVVARPQRLSGAVGVRRAGGAAGGDESPQAVPQRRLDRARDAAALGGGPVHRRAVHPAVVAALVLALGP